MTNVDPYSGREVPDRAEAARLDARGPEPERGLRVLDADDALLFAPRAVEGLGRSVLGLVDLIPGVDTGIADRRSKLLGRSDTIVGGLLEGATQALIPYAGISRGLKSVRFLQKGGALARAATAATRSGRAGEVIARIGREAAAGAGADLLAFSGSEGRLSNVLAEAGLGGPVAAFLAANKDDSEALGRLKNVLEGAALGIATDSIVALLSASRAARKVRLDGGSDEAVVQAFEREAERQELRVKTDRFLAESKRGAQAHLRNIDEARALHPDLEPEGARTAGPGERADDVAAGLEGEKARFARALAGQVDPAKVLIQEVKRRGFLSEDRIKHAMARFNALVESNAGQIRERLGGDPTKLSDEMRAVIGLAEDGANLSALMEDDVEVLALVRAIEGELGGKFNLRTPKQTEQEMALAGYALAADITQLPDDQLPEFVSSMVTDSRRMGSLAVALEVAVGSSANRVLGIYRHLQGQALDPDRIKILGIEGLQPDEALNEMFREMRRLAAWRDGSLLTRSNLGRALRSTQVPTNSAALQALGELPDIATPQAMRQFVGDKEFARRMEMLSMVGGFPNVQRTSALVRLSEMTTGRKLLAISTEWFINSLLSSPKTLTTNFLFPTATAIYLPLEQMVGGSVRYLATGGAGGGDAVTRAARTLVGMTMALGEASSAGLRAFREGPQLLAGGLKRDDLGAHGGLISSRAFGTLFGEKWGPEGPFAAVIDGIGRMSSLPTRFMNSTDEFVKTFAGRGLAYARLTEQAIAAGEDVATFVPSALDKMFQGGSAVTDEFITRRALEIAKRTGDPIADRQAFSQAVTQVREELDFDALNPITKEAIDFGLEATATADIPEGTFGATIQNAVNRHPALRLVIPFVRTPVNLVSFAGRRLDAPLSLPSIVFRKLTGLGIDNAENARLMNVRDILSNDPQRAAKAYGRLTTGIGVYTAGVTLSASGLLTGAGPEDPERRQQLLDAGWLPYSFKVGDTYVQYLRADPFSISFGLIADLAEVARFQFQEDNDQVDALAVATMTAVANNVVNRTYMAGLRSLFDAVSRGEQFAESAAANLASGFLVPRIAQAVAGIDDPVLKDAHGMLERIRARTPFLSRDVAPLRNVLGDPMDRVLSLGANPKSPASLWYDMFVPIAAREVADDEIRTELASLNYGFAPPRRNRSGIALTDVRSPKGQTAYDRWQELQGQVRLNGRTIKQELKRLMRSSAYRALPRESTPAVESPRVAAVRRTVSRYRAEAWEATIREFPDLGRRIAAVEADRARARAGLDPLSALPEAPEPFRSFAR